MLVDRFSSPGRPWFSLALGLCASASVLASTPRSARACSVAFECPVSRTVPADGGRLPANLRGFLWRTPCGAAAATSYEPKLQAVAPNGTTQTLSLQVDAADIDVLPKGNPLSYVHWEEMLEPGTQLLFSFRDPGHAQLAGAPAEGTDAGLSAPRRTIELYVTPQADIPAEVGRLATTTAFGSFRLASTDGDCSHELQASYVDLELVVGYAADPFDDALYFVTRVDDAPWHAFRESYGDFMSDEWLGGSALGRNRDRIYLPCALPNHSPAMFEELAEVLAPGHHTARMIGYLPDGTTLSSVTYELDLHCPKSDSDSGTRAPADASSSMSEQPTGRSSAASSAADSGECSVLAPGARHTCFGALALLSLSLLTRLRTARVRRSALRSSKG